MKLVVADKRVRFYKSDQATKTLVILNYSLIAPDCEDEIVHRFESLGMNIMFWNYSFDSRTEYLSVANEISVRKHFDSDMIELNARHDLGDLWVLGASFGAVITMVLIESGKTRFKGVILLTPAFVPLRLKVVFFALAIALLAPFNRPSSKAPFLADIRHDTESKLRYYASIASPRDRSKTFDKISNDQALIKRGYSIQYCSFFLKQMLRIWLKPNVFNSLGNVLIVLAEHDTQINNLWLKRYFSDKASIKCIAASGHYVFGREKSIKRLVDILQSYMKKVS